MTPQKPRKWNLPLTYDQIYQEVKDEVTASLNPLYHRRF